MTTFKLFDFQIIHEKSNEDEDIDQDQDENDDDNYSFSNTKSNLVFAIQMFGINELGETASIIVEGFQPFFYVKVPHWGQANMKEFRRHIEKQIKPYFAKHITECKLIEKKKLYGFDGGRLHRFIKFSFRNMQTFNKVKNLWFSSTTKRDESGNEHREYGIKKEGYIFNGQHLELYEANIPPLLRFFHIKDISPSGWIELPTKKTRAIPQGNKKTSCTFEFRIHYNDIIPLNHIDTLVPYKIMSFDIEASSSHGDFPVPKKTYKKLATNIVDFFEKHNEDYSVYLPKIILKAFGYDADPKLDMIDLVYPKIRPTREKLLEKIERLCTLQNDPDDVINADDDQYIENLFESIHKTQQMQNAARNDRQDDETATQAENSDQDDNSSDDDTPVIAEDELEYTPIVRQFAPKRTIQNSPKETNSFHYIATLSNSESDRETKINELLWLFKRAAFPPLEGDKITFIGSTFMKYGQKEPYFQHCIVLNSCATASTTTIESYETEAEVLLAWRNLVQRENPDIVVGYNIFNFDYEFMFRRAEELDIVAEFLQLSRNCDELCIAATNNFQQDTSTKLDIERSSITLASGTYELAIIKMNGRLQIDMLNWFRRTENLSSYKLDKVASKYIGDVVLSLEHKLSPIGEITRIKTNNMTGLQCGNFIHFEEINHSSNEYKNGAKFQVISVSMTEKWFDIVGHEMPKAKIVKWGLAKDDIEPKDIFRLTNEGAESRALVAKYCIQDCNLVHYLFNKVDAMTDLIEMSRLCSIPMSFLIFRGQGIKLTSYMAKKCREKGVLMPVIAKGSKNDAYEGAIVLEPKCGLYLDNPAAVGDFSSLYPSCAISENLCPSTKVWTKIYNLLGELLEERGEKDSKTGEFIYDNLPGYRYVDVQCDTYRYIRKHPKAKAEKIVSGYKICRFVQPIKRPDGTMEYGIVPSILQECLKARKDTRKLIPLQTDEFMKNVLDKRQGAYKVTANSLYGQLGAKTSTFYEMDIASAITAIGRKLLTYAKRIVETCYSNTDILTNKYGWVHTNAEYIYGDSVAYYTPIYVRLNGQVDILAIEDLAEKYGTPRKWYKRKMFDNYGNCIEKEVCEMVEWLETWSDYGWTPLYRVIRHHLAPHKKIMRIITDCGMVDTTDDHSLLLSSGQEISPNNIKLGDELLHKDVNPTEGYGDEYYQVSSSGWVYEGEVSPIEYESDEECRHKVDKARIMGYFFARGTLYGCHTISWNGNDKLSKYQKKCEQIYPQFHWKIIDDKINNSTRGFALIPLSKQSDEHELRKFIQYYKAQFYSKISGGKVIPSNILNATTAIQEAFWQGILDAYLYRELDEYVLSVDNLIGAAQLAFLGKSCLHKNIIINEYADIICNSKTISSNPHQAKKIEELRGYPTQQYVYDLTTSDHHFAAGIGSLIVHNTDSVFFTFNLSNKETGERILGQQALELSIEIAQEACANVSKFLKPPHDFAYEKTFLPFCLLSKKRYVGMLYETNPNKGKRKEMGIVLKRRDNAPIVKDIYGGVIDILMKERNIQQAMQYVDKWLQDLVAGNVSTDKLIISKSLNSFYKKPKQIAHKVLADRIAAREPGNKPAPGDRIPFLYITHPNKKALQGEKIETPTYIREHNLQIDYSFYITNQIMKPLLQLFGLVLEDIWRADHKLTKISKFRREVEKIKLETEEDKKMNNKITKLRNMEVQTLLFDKYLRNISNKKDKNAEITKYFKRK